MLEQRWALLDGSLYGSNYINLEGLFLGDSLVSTDGKVLVYDEGIKLGSTGGKVLGTIIVNMMESHLRLILKQIWAL